jgi:hypothetical protein
LLGGRLRLRAATVGVAVGLGAVAPVVAAPPALCAGAGPSAVLVVDRENGSPALRMCVSLPGGDVSGLEFIRLAGDQYDLQYRFGHGGAAVCQLANVPAQRPPNDCLRQGEPFWGYWRASGGGWQWSGSGAGGTRVEDGDVEGWSFGFGNDGSSHPQPPATRASDVCRPTDDGGKDGGGQKEERDRKRGDRVKGDGEKRGPETRGDTRGSQPKDPDDTTTTPKPSDPDEPVSSPDKQDGKGGRGTKPERSPGKPKSGRAPSPGSSSGAEPGAVPEPIDLPSPSPSALPADATSADDGSSESGFPAMGLVALGAAAAMGSAAAVIAIRRRKKGAR